MEKIKENPTWIIYKHICIEDGKYYIGYTKNTIEKRWKQHKIRADKNKSNTYFDNALRFYPKEDSWKHEIIECGIENQNDAKEREIFWIAIYCANNRKFGLNNTKGGDGRDSESMKGNKYTLGKKLTEEHKAKCVAVLYGRPVSAETRKKQSEANMGHKQNLGSKRTEEQKKRMSEAQLKAYANRSGPNFGKKASEETR